MLAESVVHSPPSSPADELALLLVAHSQLRAHTAAQTGRRWCSSVQACLLHVAAPGQVISSKAAYTCVPAKVTTLAHCMLLGYQGQASYVTLTATL